jgi:hypothetical protein
VLRHVMGRKLARYATAIAFAPATPKTLNKVKTFQLEVAVMTLF